MNCPKCGEKCEPQWKACSKCGTEIDAKLIPKREYKAVDFSLKGFMSTTSASDFQAILNREADNGWIFDSHVATNKDMEKGFLVFYRNVSQPEA